MLDLTLARQCWQAAYWEHICLGRAFIDNPQIPSADRLNDDQTHSLCPELSVYGPKRVLPILAAPTYSWLIESLIALFRSLAMYQQLKDQAWSRLEGFFRGQSEFLDSEVQEWPEFFYEQWLWIGNFFNEQNDDLKIMVSDCRQIQSTNRHLMGKDCLVNQLIEKDVNGGFSGLGGKTFFKSLPPWSYDLISQRVALIQNLLMEVDQQWLES